MRRLLAAVLAAGLLPAVIARADDASKLAVYDFTTSGSVSASLGGQFADALASEIGAGGGVAVIRGAPMAPAGFRADAKAHDAEYFLIGAIAPLGTRYSVIEQLVRTRTGLLVWSGTLQAGSAADLHGQGAQIRQVLLDQIGHASFPALAAAPPAASTATPARPSAPPAADHRGDAFNVPPARPTVAPPSTFAVMSFGGSALPSDRAFAVRAVLENIRRRGATAAADAAVPADLNVAGVEVCSATRAATIVGGTLDTTRISSLTAPPATTASITLQVYDCRTHVLAAKPLSSTKTTPISTDAIRSAADDATSAYFGGPPPAPRV